MPSKSLTLKFGADTSKLDRAMKRMRKSFGGLFSARGLIGGAVVGAVAGIGIKGLIGAAMNVNQKVANAMLRLEDHFAGAFASAIYRLEPTILRLIDAIIPLTEAILKAFSETVSTYTQAQSTFANMARPVGTALGGDLPTAGMQAMAAAMQLPTSMPGGISLNADLVRIMQDDLQSRARFTPIANMRALAPGARMTPGQALIDAFLNPGKYLTP